MTHPLPSRPNLRAASSAVLLTLLATAGCGSTPSGASRDSGVSDGATSRSDAKPTDASRRDAARHDASDGGAGDAGVDAAPPPRVDGADPFEYYDAGPPIVAATDPSGWSVLPGMPGTDGGYARAIYVDSVGGSDDNTGDSPTSALQGIGTSSKLESELASAGGQSIVVVLKPGSSWMTSPADQLNPQVGGTAAFPLLITGSRSRFEQPATKGTAARIFRGLFVDGDGPGPSVPVRASSASLAPALARAGPWRPVDDREHSEAHNADEEQQQRQGLNAARGDLGRREHAERPGEHEPFRSWRKDVDRARVYRDREGSTADTDEHGQATEHGDCAEQHREGDRHR